LSALSCNTTAIWGAGRTSFEGLAALTALSGTVAANFLFFCWIFTLAFLGATFLEDLTEIIFTALRILDASADFDADFFWGVFLLPAVFFLAAIPIKFQFTPWSLEAPILRSSIG